MKLKHNGMLITKSYLLDDGDYVILVEDNKIRLSKDEMNAILLDALKEMSNDPSSTDEYASNDSRTKQSAPDTRD